MNISMKTLLVAGVWCLLFGVTGTVMGVCPGCAGGEEEKAPDSMKMNAAIRYTEKLKKLLKDPSLDNPEDSTTKRYRSIENIFISAIPSNLKSYYAKEWYPILSDLAKNDPYPKVRVTAVKYLRSLEIPKTDWYEIATTALDDPHWYVRNYSASLILRRCSYDSIIPDPRVHEIVRNTSLGINRSQWHVKGFYAGGELANETEAIEKAKDTMQIFATVSLDSYIKGSTGKNKDVLDYLDSLKQRGATEKIRSAAGNSRKLYTNGK